MSRLVIASLLLTGACSSGEPSAQNSITEARMSEVWRSCVRGLEGENVKDPSEVCDCMFRDENKSRPLEETMPQCMREQM